MKKWFDKFIAQSSRGQICALAAAFAVLAVAGGIVGQFVLEEGKPETAKFGFRGTWGLMQCVDGGFVDATISSRTEVSSPSEGEEARITKHAPLLVVILSLGFWLGGMILLSFFVGVATNFLDVRRGKILDGSVDYSFKKKFILIVGYDFQTLNLIRSLFADDDEKETNSDRSIVLLTESDVEQIYADLLPELQPADARRVFIMRKDITQEDSYRKILVTGAEEIYIIGDGNAVGRDGKTLQALDAVSRVALGLLPQAKAAEAGKNPAGNADPAAGEKQKQELQTQNSPDRQIKVYLHIEDPVLYSSVRAIELSMDPLKIFDLNVFNYYESWAWECWSHKDSRDGSGEAYLPIRYKQGTEHAELFVIGASRMGLAMANFAMPLMNYGGDGKHCRITVFDPDGSRRSLLPDQKTLDALPELEVVFRPLDGCSEEANALILEAAGRKDTSVTVVIAIPDPAAAIRVYSGFSKRLCREDISVLIWQATAKGSVPGKSYLRMGGTGSDADKRRMRYFGMTDFLPWKESARFNYGMAVNYYYNCWFPYGKDAPASPEATASDFIEKSNAMWDPERPEASCYNGVVAGTEWMGTKRWKKWSSVNSGDTFREKSLLFDGVPYETAAVKILKAEHNRWWTERILAGWLPAEPGSVAANTYEADKNNMFHGAMIPFEGLPEKVKDKDKINIAAMAACGFLKQTK